MSLQILTLWQGCVAICHAFPVSPDVLAMVHAIAEEAGEPAAEAIAATCMGTSADQGIASHALAAYALLSALLLAFAMYKQHFPFLVVKHQACAISELVKLLQSAE